MESPGRIIKDYAGYLVVRIFVCILQAMSIEACHRVSQWLAWLFTNVIKIRTKILDENLSKSFPEWSEKKRTLTKQKMWEHLLLMICEIAHAPRKIHETNWRKYVSIRGKREMVRAMTDDRPLLVVSGHYGNFEIGGFIGGLLGFRNFTVARTLDNPYVDQFLNHFRQLNGQYTIPKDGSSQYIEKVLDNDEMLVLLGDQHAGNSGCWVDFLGRPASCHKAVALFTLTGGAPMLVLYTRRSGKPMHFEIGVQGYLDPEVLPDELQGVRALTNWYSEKIEEMVLDEPTQYWWVHRRWREKPARRIKREPKKRAA